VSTDEQACDYFRLTSKDGEAAIEVFVFDGGKPMFILLNICLCTRLKK